MSMPNKSSIAKYWLKEHLEPYSKIEQLSDFQKKLALQDWGEPSCWACGMWRNTSDCTDPDASVATIFKSWNGAKFLERCHIIPRMLGGTDECSNLVLLCKQCHKESPDVKSTKFMKRWITQRKPHGSSFIEALSEISKEAIQYASNNHKDFIEYLYENAGQHGGQIADTTKAYLIECFYEDRKCP